MPWVWGRFGHGGSRSRLLLTALGVAVALAAAGSTAARAATSSTTIDGPSADIGLKYDIAVAPDGTAAVAYLKKDGGQDHVFVSRYEGGTWTAPERVDPGLATASNFPDIAAANGGRIVASFLNDTRAYSAIRPSAGQPFALVPIVDPSFTQFKALSVHMNAAGIAYAAYVDFSFDLRASRLEGTTWAAVGAAHPDPAGILNNDASKQVKTDYGVSVAVAGDGNAALAWSEPDAANEEQAYLRRLNGTAAGAIHRASIDALDGAPKAGFADMTDLDADQGGNYMVVFRELFKYVLDEPRIIARRLSASGTLEPASAIDGLPPNPASGAEFPDVEMNASGQVLAGHLRQEIVEAWGSALVGGGWSAFLLDGTVRARTVAALGDSGNGAFVWSRGAGGVVARPWRGGTLGTEESMSAAAFGDTADPRAGADDPGNVFAVFTQGDAANRRVVVGRLDAPPLLPPPDTVSPALSGLRVKPPRFRLGTRLPRLLPSARRGAQIRFTLSEPASVRLEFAAARPGRRVGRKCLSPTRARRSRPRCTRYVKLPAALTIAAREGLNRVRFDGRLTAARSLKPGRHRITATATDEAGNRSARRSARFSVVRRR